MKTALLAILLSAGVSASAVTFENAAAQVAQLGARTAALREIVQRPLAVRGNPKCYQPLQCAGTGTVTIDDAVKIGVFPSPFFFSIIAGTNACESNTDCKTQERN